MRIKKIEKTKLKAWDYKLKMALTLEQKLGEEAIKEISGRSFGINPNLKYSEKEFLERAEDLFRVDACYKKIIKNGSDIGALSEFSGIATKYMPGDRGENVKILKDPFMAEKQAKVLLNSGYKNMASYTAKNLNSLLKEMSKENLIETAASLPDKRKGYTQIIHCMQVGDMKAARKAYAETFGSEAWKKFILECPDAELIQNRMNMYTDYKKKEFIDRNLSIKLENGKEKIYEPDFNRAKEYISRTIAKYGDKERLSVYLGIATELCHSKRDIGEKEEDKTEELREAA